MLAVRNLLLRKLRTFITVFGIAIGVATVIFLVGLGSGLRALVIAQIATPAINRTVTVTTSGSTSALIKPSDVTVLSKRPEVQSLASEKQYAGTVQLDASTVETIVHATSSKYLGLSPLTYTAGGEFKAGQVVINQALARALQISKDASALGRKITLKTSDGQSKSFTVGGVDDGFSSPHIYVSAADQGSAASGGYTSVMLRLRDSDAGTVKGIRNEVASLGYHSDYIGDTVTQVSDLFTIFIIILGAFGLIALVVAILGSINTLTVNLLEKTREVGFMKALGVQRRDIKKIFITESLLLSICGCVFGLALAYALSEIVTKVLYRMAGPGYPAGIHFFAFSWQLLGSSFVIMLVIGWLTGTVPAGRAARINPLEALRYE